MTVTVTVTVMVFESRVGDAVQVVPMTSPRKALVTLSNPKRVMMPASERGARCAHRCMFPTNRRLYHSLVLPLFGMNSASVMTKHRATVSTYKWYRYMLPCF